MRVLSRTLLLTSIFALLAVGCTDDLTGPRRGGPPRAPGDTIGANAAGGIISMGSQNDPPTATFEGPDTGSVGEALEYTTSATDPDGDALTCRINWGDGTPEAEVPCDGTLTHTYTKTGSFVIFFTARDPGGLVAEARLRVTIIGNQAPTPTIDGPDEGDVGEELSFTTDATDPDDPESSLECAINWGDGSGFVDLASCDAGATHTFDDDGQFVVRLRATDPAGASDTAAHVVTITGNEAPKATLVGPEEGEVGEALAYTTSATDPDGDPLTCRINWGDGSAEVALASCDAGASHTYTKAGDFIIFFTARDPGGLVAEVRHPVTIGDVNHPPEATLGGPTTGVVGQVLSFTTGATDPDDDTPLVCAINFGDGGGFTALANCGAGASHTYTKDGSFNVVLRVRDPDGAEGTATLTVKVETAAENHPPIPVIGGPHDGDVNETLTFTTSATDPDNDTPLTCEIDWGDDTGGVIACNGTRTHSFKSAGTFTVTLRARDPHGAEGTTMWEVVVEEPPPPPACSEGTGARPTLELVGVYSRIAVRAVSAGTAIPDAEMLRFSFRDADCGPWAAHVEWGDGEESDFPISEALGPGLYNTYHRYATPGDYVVRMTITDRAGLASAERSIPAHVIDEGGTP